MMTRRAWLLADDPAGVGTAMITTRGRARATPSSRNVAQPKSSFKRLCLPPGVATIPFPGVSSGGCRGRVSFMPSSRFRWRLFWPGEVRAGAAIPGQVVDVHGKQNGAIYQQVTLGRSDIAPVSLLAEDGADVLERCINGKYSDHSPHLHHRHTAREPGRSRALVLTVGPPCYR